MQRSEENKELDHAKVGGNLKVLGTRFSRSSAFSMGALRYLHAFRAVNGKPLQADWKCLTFNRFGAAGPVGPRHKRCSASGCLHLGFLASLDKEF